MVTHSMCVARSSRAQTCFVPVGIVITSRPSVCYTLRTCPTGVKKAASWVVGLLSGEVRIRQIRSRDKFVRDDDRDTEDYGIIDHCRLEQRFTTWTINYMVEE